MTKVKLLGASLVLLLLAGLSTQVMRETRGRHNVLLTVLQVDRVHERAHPIVFISYKSTWSEWRKVEYRSFKPWNRTVSVEIGDVVYLEARQRIANRLDCLITQPNRPGAIDNDTRESAGVVKCKLLVK